MTEGTIWVRLFRWLKRILHGWVINCLYLCLSRLNKQKIDKLRQDYGENSETYKGFHHMFWAFSKTCLTQTITKIPTQDVEQQALQISLAILTYAGLNPNGKVVMSCSVSVSSSSGLKSQPVSFVAFSYYFICCIIFLHDKGAKIKQQSCFHIHFLA